MDRVNRESYTLLLQPRLVINTKETGVFLNNLSCCKLSNKCDTPECISVFLLWRALSEQQHGWFIKAEESLTHIAIFTTTFLSIICVWIPRSWHTTTPTEMSLWRCWWLTYTEMKGTKYLGRKWQPALPSYITLLKQVQDYKWMNRGRLSVSISNLASFSNFLQGHREKTDWKPQTETRSCDKIGCSHLCVR